MGAGENHLAANFRRGRLPEGAVQEKGGKQQANSNTGDWEMELISADLSDTCMHFGVHPDEIQNCLAPGLDDDELVPFKAMSFGFKGAPLVMGRFSSAAMRLCQSMMPEAPGRSSATWTTRYSCCRGHYMRGWPCWPWCCTGQCLWTAAVICKGRAGHPAIILDWG